MDFSNDEAAEAARDMMALTRAVHDGDSAALEVLLDGRDTCELQAIVRTFATGFHDLFARLCAAAGVIDDDRTREIILKGDTAEMLADPGVHAFIEANISATHARLVAGATP